MVVVLGVEVAVVGVGVGVGLAPAGVERALRTGDGLQAFSSQTQRAGPPQGGGGGKGESVVVVVVVVVDVGVVVRDLREKAINRKTCVCACADSSVILPTDPTDPTPLTYIDTTHTLSPSFTRRRRLFGHYI